MEKLQCFFPHWVLRLKPEMILQNKIKTFCWLNTYKEWNVGRKFGFYLSSDFGTNPKFGISGVEQERPICIRMEWIWSWCLEYWDILQQSQHVSMQHHLLR